MFGRIKENKTKNSGKPQTKIKEEQWEEFSKKLRRNPGKKIKEESWIEFGN